MHAKRRTYIIAALLISLSVFAAAASAEVFASLDYDLGTLPAATNAPFEITLTNTFSSKVRILSIKPSCGCTTIDSGNSELMPKGTLAIKGHIDTRGKIGVIMKTLEIQTDASSKPVTLHLRAFIAHKPDNLTSASVIFEAGCRDCHVKDNVEQRRGQGLYDTVCFICHRGPANLTMREPGLLAATIANGLTGTSMPGFATQSGGPLSMEQVRSLVAIVANTPAVK